MVPPRPGVRREPRPQLSPTPGKRYRVELHTNCGTITILMDMAQSPNAVASFLWLVVRQYYDRTVFHRVVPGFVIQAGDPTATGTGGPGYATVDRPPRKAKYSFGVVAMAKTATEPPGTAGSQFFIVTSRDAGLPPDYAIIGRVTSGQDVVRRIGRLGDASQQPTRTIEIISATIG